MAAGWAACLGRIKTLRAIRALDCVVHLCSTRIERVAPRCARFMRTTQVNKKRSAHGALRLCYSFRVSKKAKRFTAAYISSYFHDTAVAGASMVTVNGLRSSFAGAGISTSFDETTFPSLSSIENLTLTGVPAAAAM